MKKHPKKKISIAAIFTVILFLLAGIAVGFYINRGRVEVASEQTEASRSIVESDPESIPAYAGSDYIILNNDKPCFNAWDLENITGEHYSELDRLGRCGGLVFFFRFLRLAGGQGDQQQCGKQQSNDSFHVDSSCGMVL